MYLNKLTITILVAVSIAIYLIALTMNNSSNKLFKFEDFKTREVAQEYFDNNYKINSNYKKLIKDLRLAGSVCEYTKLKTKEKEYKAVIRCVYNSGWISLRPLVDYVLVIYVGKQDEIIKLDFNQGYVGP
jgi:hypothetical protein